MQRNRPQIRVQTERLPQTEQSLLRPNLGRWIVPLGTADRAEKDRVRLFAQRDSLGRKRGARAIDRDAADERVVRLEGVPELPADSGEGAHALSGYFRTDSIACQYCDLRVHE